MSQEIKTLEHKAAKELYDYIFQDETKKLPFWFQTMEEAYAGCVIALNGEQNLPVYFSDRYKHLSFDINFIAPIVNHQEQLELVERTLKRLTILLGLPSFKIERMLINGKSVISGNDVLFYAPNYSETSQRYQITVEMVVFALAHYGEVVTRKPFVDTTSPETPLKPAGSVEEALPAPKPETEPKKPIKEVGEVKEVGGGE